MTPFDELSRLLWDQRQLIDLLLYKLEVEQLVLAAGRTRWIDQSAREVGAVLDELREVDLIRASCTTAVAGQLGLPPEPTLREICDAAQEPWAEIFRDHLGMLVTSIGNLEELAEANRELLARGLHDTQTFLSSLEVDSAAEGYSRTGSAGTTGPTPTVLDTEA